MSVLIKDMEKPKSCYAITDGEAEFCPFVNTDDDCVLLLKKGICEETWEMQYSKCPLVEVQEPCEDDKGCSNCMYGGRPTYKSPCSECHDKSQWEMKPISRSHENGAECEDTVSRQKLLNDLEELIAAWEKYPVMAERIKGVETAIEYVETIPSVTPKRKMGEWISPTPEMIRGRICGSCEVLCSACKTPAIDEYNFCPNCGADMREKQNKSEGKGD